MALLHRARLHPTKLELLAAWFPSRGWYQGPTGAEVERVASYRFDDPAGAVGIETMIVAPPGGPIYQEGGAAGPVLTGTWAGLSTPLRLASAQLR